MPQYPNWTTPGYNKPTQQQAPTGNYIQNQGRWYTGTDDYQKAAGGGQLGWYGGKYGYVPQNVTDTLGAQKGFSSRYFKPFANQPTPGAPQQYTNPAAYQRNQLTDQYQTALDEAKAKTEERYQEALSNLEGVGEQEGRDIDTRFDSNRSAVGQSLVSSGLSGTSVLPSMQRGVERERTAAQSRLASMLARERNQIISSRNDIPPDLNMLVNLLRQQGMGGGR